MGEDPHHDRLQLRTLRADQVTREVVTAFREQAIRTILLKGPTVAAWLYPDRATRTYADSDLLVSPADWDRAQDTLAGLGFRKGQLAVTEFARTWLRPPEGDVVDLHRFLYGGTADAGLAWAVLSRDTETISVAGASVEMLCIPARALHVAAHAAQHGATWTQPGEDLDRALALAPDAVWDAAAELARELDMEGVMALGLATHPAGAPLVARLGLQATETPLVRLRSGAPPPIALGLAHVEAAQGTAAKLRAAGRALFPSRVHMRGAIALARRGPAGLVAAYAIRLVRMLPHTVAGWRAWRQARR